MKSRITEMSNSLEGFNRYKLAEERISEFKDKSIENIKSEKQIVKRMNRPSEKCGTSLNMPTYA